MNKLLLAIGALGICTLSHAQSIEIQDADKNPIESGTAIPTDASTLDNVYKMYFKNTGSSSMDVRVKRYEMFATAGTRNYMCFGICPLPSEAGADFMYPASDNPVYESFKETLDAGATSTFSADQHFMPAGISGASAHYRVVFYTDANPDDSVYVDVLFGTNVGVEDFESNNNLSLVPNPIRDHATLSFDLTNWNSTAQAAVYDLLGNRVSVMQIPTQQGTMNFDVSTLRSGVYFLSYEVDGIPLHNQKFVID